MPHFWRKSDLNPKYKMDAAMLASEDYLEIEFNRFYGNYESEVRDSLIKLRDWNNAHQESSYEKLLYEIYKIYLAKFNSRTDLMWYKPEDRFLDEEMIADLKALNEVVRNPNQQNRNVLRERVEKPWASFVSGDFRQYMFYSLFGLGLAVSVSLPFILPLLVPIFVSGAAILYTIAAAIFIIPPLFLGLAFVFYHHNFDILNAHNKMYELSLNFDVSAPQQEDASLNIDECVTSLTCN